MQGHDPLTTIFQHNLWANLRLLESCTELTEEQLARDLLGTYASVRDTLQHIVTSERSYFARISTGQRYDHPDETTPMSVAEMIAMARETGSGLVEWATKVNADDTVVVDWEGRPRAVPKSILMVQAIDHAADHRSQIKTILTHLGIEPPDLQGWAFFDEMDGSA